MTLMTSGDICSMFTFTDIFILSTLCLFLETGEATQKEIYNSLTQKN